MPWVRVIPDPNDPNKFMRVPTSSTLSLSSLFAGYKTYLVVIVAIIKLWYPIFVGHPLSPEIDNALTGTLIALGVATVRSAINTSTAQISNAVVNPTSTAAIVTAAKAPGADPAGPKTVG